MISLKLSDIAYCGRDAYMTHNFTKELSGFVVTSVIYSGKVDDTEGFVGVLPSDNSIYVSFRGSSDMQNWITNLSTIRTNYKSYPECKSCGVHLGFYSAE